MPSEFDPLDYRTIADTVVAALLARPPEPLPPAESFPGAGVYLLYYRGAFEHYAPVSGKDKPIYVGKAIPAGSRRGAAAPLQDIEHNQPPALFGRLRKHAQSINACENLELADFLCRYLVVTPIWIEVAEALLIARFRPVWNAKVDGFGLNDPGRTRHGQRRSDWDTLHPGRSWSAHMNEGKSIEQIINGLNDHFRET